MGGAGNHIRWLCLLDDRFLFDINNAVDKVEFILNEIYPTNRSWQTWLEYEWRHRKRVNSIIYFGHEYVGNDSKSLYISVTPEICLRHYIKLNSQLNGFNIESFKQYVSECNDEFYNLDMYTVPGDVFFNNVLPYNTYMKIINYFDLSDNYQKAKIIHERWVSLNKDAEENIGDWFNNFYNT